MSAKQPIQPISQTNSAPESFVHPGERRMRETVAHLQQVKRDFQAGKGLPNPLAPGRKVAVRLEFR